MGHRRLSIVDLSDAAHQPFVSDDGRHILIFNGEIYNFIELRDELASLGHVFHTRSDTEVMLKALVEWGNAALTKFDGMFAAAWHDRHRNRHLLMRDPLGQKPLYWCDTGKGVAYASEMRALLELEAVPHRLDRAAFVRYLANACHVWDETPVAGIHKLPPGCVLAIDNGQTRVERYWDQVPGQNQLDITDDEALDEFERLFDRSCAIAMRSDVPIGVMLSGGVDSALVLSSCHAINPQVQSFCVAMGEADYDESAKAHIVRDYLGIECHRDFVLDREGIVATLDDFLAHVDEPHGDPGFVNAMFLSRQVRKDITVGLAGDGGDELFAGYAPFAGLGPLPLLRRLPASLVDGLKSLVDLLPASDGYLGLKFKARAYLQGFPGDNDIRLPLWLSTLAPEQLALLCPSLGTEFFRRHAGGGGLFDPVARLPSQLGTASAMHHMLYYYQKIFLPEFVCAHTDRAAMAASLEMRSPFLSLPLVEFVNRLPDRFKAEGRDLKVLPRRLLQRRGFPTAITAQRKQGFTFPLARWLKSSLRDHVAALAVDDALEGLVERSQVANLLEQHFSGRQNNYRILFNLLVFSAWRRRYPGLEIA